MFTFLLKEKYCLHWVLIMFEMKSPLLKMTWILVVWSLSPVTASSSHHLVSLPLPGSPCATIQDPVLLDCQAPLCLNIQCPLFTQFQGQILGEAFVGTSRLGLWLFPFCFHACIHIPTLYTHTSLLSPIARAISYLHVLFYKCSLKMWTISF